MKPHAGHDAFIAGIYHNDSGGSSCFWNGGRVQCLLVALVEALGFVKKSCCRYVSDQEVLLPRWGEYCKHFAAGYGCLISVVPTCNLVVAVRMRVVVMVRRGSCADGGCS